MNQHFVSVKSLLAGKLPTYYASWTWGEWIQIVKLEDKIEVQSVPTTIINKSNSHIKHLLVFKAKEKLWKFKYFTIAKNNLQHNPLKETKILQHIIIL
jgi:hypothetical protein